MLDVKIRNANHDKTESRTLKVFQYTLDGELVKVWDSVNDARRKYGDICKCLKKKANSAYGFYWSYIECDSIPEKTKKTARKKLYQYDLNGNFIKEWKTKKDIIEFYKITNKDHLYNCFSGKEESYLNYLWKEI